MTTLATIEELIEKRNPDHQVTIEPCAKWIRVMHNGEYIADTRQAVLLHETNHVPVYYFPKEDVRLDLMEPTDHVTQCPYKGDASYLTLKVPGASDIENSVWIYSQPMKDCPDISNYIAFYWNKVDHWFEEDEEELEERRARGRVDPRNQRGPADPRQRPGSAGQVQEIVNRIVKQLKEKQKNG